MVSMKKSKKLGIFFCICAMMLAACGKAEIPEQVEENTLVVDQDGTIHSYLVGDFEMAHYDVPELTKMAMEETASYNGKAVVDKVEQSADGSRIYVNYTFADGEIFSDFLKNKNNEGLFFYGTVEEAKQSGYRLDMVALTSVKDGSMTTGGAVEQKASDKHILITDQKALIYCPYEVTYVGEGAVCLKDGTVDTTKADEMVFILMKK